MPVTITLNDKLVGQLSQQARERQTSLEHLTLSILNHAAEHPQELQSWTSLNQRRLDLIDKRYSTGLNEAEEREYAELQAAVAQLLEPWDRARNDRLVPYEQLAAQLSQTNE